MGRMYVNDPLKGRIPVKGVDDDKARSHGKKGGKRYEVNQGVGVDTTYIGYDKDRVSDQPKPKEKDDG